MIMTIMMMMMKKTTIIKTDLFITDRDADEENASTGLNLSVRTLQTFIPLLSLKD